MSNIVRIGDRFINLDYTHVDFGATHYNQSRPYAKEPAIRIYLLASSRGDEYLEYKGAEMALVSPFLARALGDLAFRQLDLPGQRWATADAPIHEIVAEGEV